MADTITITLAGQHYQVGRLTLGQIKALGIALRQPYSDDPAVAEGEAYDRMAANVSAALSRAFPDLTAEALMGMEITLAELQEANRKVLEHSGLVAAKPSGEGTAEAS